MLVLASASPRRQELLRNAGIPFEVQPTDIPEIPKPGEAPQSFAERMAREKALMVAQQRPRDHILGADTIVVVDNQILGKPSDKEDAARMLRMLSGKTHQVTTAVCLLSPRSPESKGAQRRVFEDTRSETTWVTMHELTEEDIRSYVATREPMDKAGAYAIQGIAARWIPRIAGDYSNVVGLPVSLVHSMLRERGVL